jgi:hypothetical protein
MHKSFKKLTSMIVGSVLAAASAASSFSAVAPSLNANAADNDNYARLLQYSLYFYDANMCGDTSKGGMSWRSNCHMDDEVPGGFHDAGDHAMFGLPQGYTASTLGWAYHEFPDAFTATGQDAHLKVITDHFCDFFKRSTKLSGGNVTNFLYQKGDGNEDHGYWGPPEKQGSRKMFWTSNGASDIAAEYSAALAANYVNFGNKDDLTYAEALYKFSKQNNRVTDEGPKGFYNSNGPADEQAWAAGWLYLATNNQSYLNDLKGNLPKVGWVHGWNDTHLGANCLYGEITGDWSGANGYISGKATGNGYMFLDKWGSARINCSMQMTSLIATAHKAGDYKAWAKGQMNYILGQNPANTCYVTGFASNSAKNAHHRAASGYTGYDQFNMNGWNPDGDHMSPFCAYGPNAHPLIGALVGGPCDAGGSYHDNMADYICNEVAIDYNAGLVGAAAGLYHFYKTGSIDKNINGVSKIYSGGNSQPPQQTTTQTTQQTTTQKTQTPQQTTTTTPSIPEIKDGEYVVKTNKEIDYSKLPENDKMIGFSWKDFGIKSGEYATKIEFNLSSSKNLGTWVGAFGSSTTVAPDYWTMSDEFNKSLSGNSATVTWEPSASDAKTFAYSNGELKFGVWWIDCGQFTIDSIKVYTAAGSSEPVTTTTKATTTTRATTTTTTTRPTTTTTKATTTSSVAKATRYGDVNGDGLVTAADAVTILQYIGNKDKYSLSETAKANADVSGNDGITPNDALTILRVDAGDIKLSDLPINK